MSMTSKEKASYRKTKHWSDRRDAVIKRDGKRCAFCGCRITGKVHVHHTTDDDYCSDDIKNLVVLCPACHSYVSKKFERRKDWAEVAPLLRRQLKKVLKSATY
jgi:5-methylcytosine-specific restriction endonuclease McrA